MKLLMVVGSCNQATPYFAKSGDTGISVFNFDTETGEHTLVTHYDRIANPTYLSVSDDGRRIYANSELFNAPQGLVTTLAFDAKANAITHLDMQPSRGSITAHSSITHDERFLLVANYQRGHEGPDKSLVVFPIQENKILGQPVCEVTHSGHGTVSARQERSHAHFIGQLPGRDVIVADLGLDQVIVYRLSDDGALRKSCSIAMAGGAGPRHLAWNADGSRVFVVNEINSTVSSLAYDQTMAKLSMIDTVEATSLDGDTVSHCSGIQISPDHHHLYVGNRGEDTVAVFDIAADGRLSKAGRSACNGKTPRDLAVTPCGNWVMSANQDSDAITVFRRSAKDGTLIDVGNPIKVSVPMCIKFAVDA